MEGDKARGGVGQDVEVGGGGRTHGERAALRVHLVVHQTPLLQERMHPRVGAARERKGDERERSIQRTEEKMMGSEGEGIIAVTFFNRSNRFFGLA